MRMELYGYEEGNVTPDRSRSPALKSDYMCTVLRRRPQTHVLFLQLVAIRFLPLVMWLHNALLFQHATLESTYSLSTPARSSFDNMDGEVDTEMIMEEISNNAAFAMVFGKEFKGNSLKKIDTWFKVGDVFNVS